MLNSYDFDSDMDYQEYLDRKREQEEKQNEYEDNYFDLYEEELQRECEE